MPKIKTRFVCQECGHETLKWAGRCPSCQAWNSLVEEIKVPETNRPSPSSWLGASRQSAPVPLLQVETMLESRVFTGMSEIDRVLGGGLVPGSLVLIGGDPGIGKSTLLLQLCDMLAAQGLKCLYVSGEESTAQIRMRAHRLGMGSDNILVLPETDLDLIQRHVKDIAPQVLVIDSIQTMYDGRISSAPGSVGQVRECTAQLTAMSKGLGMACFIVGHVTKAGAIAGPRVLEHMVDTVLYFEGDRHHQYRIIRAVKNRFGSTNEIGVFEIRDSGLKEIPNPSSMWLGENTSGIPGSVITCLMEGSRPFLVEIQALVCGAGMANPRRVTTGVDHNRANIISAVLDKRAGLSISNQDIYVSVAGGFTMDEPAGDLAVALALASSFKNRAMPKDTVVIGEVGLAGEVRSIDRLEFRVKEAAKLGFKTCFVPSASLKYIEWPADISVYGVKSVSEAIDSVIGGVRVD